VSPLSIDAYLTIIKDYFYYHFLFHAASLIIHIALSVYGLQKHMAEPLKKKTEENKKKINAGRLELTSLLFTEGKYTMFPVSSKQNIWITLTLH